MTILDIRPGEIHIDSIDTIVDEPHIKIWHINLDSKYADVVYYGDHEIALCATDQTLRTDPDHEGQATILILPPGDWSTIAECTRYTCRIAAYLWKP